jgi:chorismate mutase
MKKIKQLEKRFDNSIKDIYQIVGEANQLGRANALAAILLYLSESLEMSKNKTEKQVIKTIITDINNAYVNDEYMAELIQEIIKDIVAEETKGKEELDLELLNSINKNNNDPDLN